jgi:AcrR family transcriptional regulator
VGNGTAPVGKGEKRRAEIVAVARRVLVEDGYDFFSMREIAGRVGVQLGNLQYYYPTRDDLLEAVVRAEFARNQADVAAIAVGDGTTDARLAAVARHLMQEWAHEGGRVYAVMSLLAIHHRQFRDLHREIYAAFYEGLLPMLRELRPRARRPELLGIARIVTTILDGALVQEPDRRFVGDAVNTILRVARG